MTEAKTTIAYIDKEFYVGGKNLRQVSSAVHYFPEEVTIIEQTKEVKNIKRFNELFSKFNEIYPLSYTIDKINCEPLANKLQITLSTRLKKVHSAYKLNFFFCEYLYMQEIEGIAKEIRLLQEHPSLPLPDSEEEKMTVDQAKVKELEKKIKSKEKALEEAREDFPDIEMNLSTIKSEYKDMKTVVTFYVSAEDVHILLGRKIKILNDKCGLFLTPFLQ